MYTTSVTTHVNSRDCLDCYRLSYNIPCISPITPFLSDNSKSLSTFGNQDSMLSPQARKKPKKNRAILRTQRKSSKHIRYLHSSLSCVSINLLVLPFKSISRVLHTHPYLFIRGWAKKALPRGNRGILILFATYSFPSRFISLPSLF